jgi:hypothetical protein
MVFGTSDESRHAVPRFRSEFGNYTLRAADSRFASNGPIAEECSRANLELCRVKPGAGAPIRLAIAKNVRADFGSKFG